MLHIRLQTEDTFESLMMSPFGIYVNDVENCCNTHISYKCKLRSIWE